MRRPKRILSRLLLAGIMLAIAPSGGWGTSAVPDPGAVGIPIDSTAAGTKVFGPLSVAFELEFVPEPTKKNEPDPLPPSASPCPSRIVANNMFVVVTFEKRTDAKVFNRDFSRTAPVTQPICFENQAAQVTFVFNLISEEVMPFFFGSPIRHCLDTLGVSPCWAVKSVTNFLSSGTGAVSMNAELATR